MKLPKKLLTVALSVAMAVPGVIMSTSGIGYADSSTKIIRIAGSNRYDTSYKVSQSVASSYDNVIIANGTNYADALAGGVLTKNSSPMFLTDGKTLTRDIKDAVSKAKEVTILGGTSSVSDEIEKSISSTKKVTRLAGKNRYETSVKIAEKINSKSVMIANGENFPDALSGVSVALNKNMPIVLTRAKELSPEVSNFLSQEKFENATLLGGSNSVSANAESQIRKSVGTISRISGSNRFATSVELAKQISNPSTIILVSGENFPDALSASALAAKNNAPIVLTGKLMSSTVASYIRDVRADVNQIIIVGGTGSVSNEVPNQVKDALNNKEFTIPLLDESSQANSSIKEKYTGKDASGRPIFDKAYEDMFYYSEGALRLKTPKKFGEKGMHIKNLVIPSTYKGVTVKKIGNFMGAFDNVEIPDTVTEIEDSCFSGADVGKIKLSENLERIGKEAFKNNKNLTDIKFNNKLKTIGVKAFFTTGLKSVDIPDSVVTIENGAFRFCELNSITIGNSVKTIATDAFDGTGVKTLVIPDSVEKIGERAFPTMGIESLTLGKSLKEIGNYAFEQNELTSVVIPDSVDIVGTGAFYSNKINDLKIGNSVKTIGSGAFEHNKIKTLEIPGTVETVGEGSFSWNPLSSLKLGEGITNIGNLAFSETELTEVTVPKSTVELGRDAFDSKKVKTIKVPGALKNIEEIKSVFENCIEY